MRESDLQEADRIMRLAFGTFLGLPDPMSFAGDADYVRTRYRTDPSAALAAEVDGRLAGSNFALHWGSVGVFGPLTIHPNFWDRGVARLLLEETMKIFERWQVRHAGLFTFAQSSKHVHLYQKFGFWPRFLTAIMSKPVNRVQANFVCYSQLSAHEKEKAIEECRALVGGLYDGLDLSKEIHAVDEQRLGDTVLVYDGSLAGFAVCHCGPGTEAGSGSCYVKFGAASPGKDSEKYFETLLDACESFAGSQGLSRLIAGVNTARTGAYKSMIARKFRTDIQGVAMQKPNEPGYNREDVYLIDDWR
jgi:GNAT superfamily N-acetyltransferase